MKSTSEYNEKAVRAAIKEAKKKNMTRMQIAEALNKEGYQTQRGREWSAHTVGFYVAKMALAKEAKAKAGRTVGRAPIKRKVVNAKSRNH